MPGDELKRKLSQLPGLFKSLPGKAEGVLRSPRWHRRAACLLELTLGDLAIVQARSPLVLAAGPENSPPSPGLPQGKIRRLYIDAEMQSLLRLAPVADAIKLGGLALSVTHLTRTLRHRDNAMRELAVQRAVAVRDYLAVSGIAPGRLFLGAPKSVPADAK